MQVDAIQKTYRRWALVNVLAFGRLEETRQVRPFGLMTYLRFRRVEARG